MNKQDAEFAMMLVGHAPLRRNISQCADNAVTLQRLARSLERLNVLECNEGLTPKQERGREALQHRVLRIVSWRAEFSDDPRGFSVKLHGFGRGEGWGL